MIDSSEYIDLRDAINDSDMDSDIKEKLLEVIKEAANVEEDEDDEDTEDDPQVYSDDHLTVDLTRVVVCKWNGDILNIWVEHSETPFSLEREDGERFLKQWRGWLR